MERRHFLKLAIGVAAGAAAFAASAQAAPLSPQPLAGAEAAAAGQCGHSSRGDVGGRGRAAKAGGGALEPPLGTGITGAGITATGAGIAGTGVGIAATGAGVTVTRAGTTGTGTAVIGKARLPLTGRNMFCTSPKSPRCGKSERKGKRL